MEETPVQEPKMGLFSGLLRNKKYVAKISLLCLIFWALQFIYQFYFASSGVVSFSLIRSFSFSGATLIGIALILGPLTRLTKINLVFHRRAVGVWGFTFTILHVLTVLAVVFNFSLAAIFWSTDIFVNFLIFGLLGFIIFLPSYLTSTDWALRKFGTRKWKFLHRLVYIAYILAVLHYLNTNPAALATLAGYILYIVTGLVFLLQVLGFVKTIKRTKSKKDLLIGILLILFGLVLFYLTYR